MSLPRPAGSAALTSSAASCTQPRQTATLAAIAQNARFPAACRSMRRRLAERQMPTVCQTASAISADPHDDEEDEDRQRNEGHRGQHELAEQEDREHGGEVAEEADHPVGHPERILAAPVFCDEVAAQASQRQCRARCWLPAAAAAERELVAASRTQAQAPRRRSSSRPVPRARPCSTSRSGCARIRASSAPWSIGPCRSRPSHRNQSAIPDPMPRNGARLWVPENHCNARSHC